MPLGKKSFSSHATNDASSSSKLKGFFSTTLELIFDLRDDTDRQICEEFQEIPSSEIYPDYPQVVKNPIAMSEIIQKVDSGLYDSAEEFLKDFELMSHNAKLFNGADSWVAEDSTTIVDTVKEQLKRLQQGQVFPEKSPQLKLNYTNSAEDFSGELTSVLRKVMDHKAPKRGKVSAPFMDMIDGDEYPDYYQVVSRGMSFNQVRQNMENGEYANGEEGCFQFEADVQLIFDNARLYNHEESLLFQDAEALNDVLDSVFEEFLLDNQIERPAVPVKARGEPKPQPKIETLPQEPQSLGWGQMSPNMLTTPHVPLNLPPPIPAPQDYIPEGPPKKKRGRKPKNRALIEAQEAAIQGFNAPKLLRPELEMPPETPPKEKAPMAFNKAYETRKEKNQAMIQEITLTSSMISQISNSYQKSGFASANEKFFEYKLPISNTAKQHMWSISLPLINRPTTIVSLLSPSLLQRSYTSSFMHNGERLAPAPSMMRYDEDFNKVRLTSKYELRLCSGLNLIEYECFVQPQTEIDETTGKLLPRFTPGRINSEHLIREKATIWINVAQGSWTFCPLFHVLYFYVYYILHSVESLNDEFRALVKDNSHQ